MASTYSTSLRLELIGTGEQSGTWGTTTNTNLGTLLEQAIGGYQSITMTDADYTLSTANGVVDEARNAVLRFTGTLTAARNVLCPDGIEKVYIVENATTNGFAITFKTVSGTGISIPNGAEAILFADGTNVRMVTNITSAGAALLDDADAAAQRTTLGLGTGDSPQFTAVNIGNASDTTLSRVSAGVAAIEGKNIALNGTSETFTTGTIELGNASDTTITRSAAGVIAVEGGIIPKENRTNTFTASQLINTGAANASLNISANAGYLRFIDYTTALSSRFRAAISTAAETGSNAGSNYEIYRYSDAGAFISTPLSINRATGLTTLESLQVSGSSTISTAVGASLSVSGGAGYYRSVNLQTAGSQRWFINASNAAESGSNAGSDFGIWRYSDTGVYLGAALSINRATGLTTLESLQVNGASVISVTDNTNAALRITQLGTGNAILVEDSTNPDATPFVVDSNGRIIAGHTSSTNFASGYPPQIQNMGSTAQGATIGTAIFSADANGANLAFLKSRSTTVGTLGTVVNANDLIGSITFFGDDGSLGRAAASINGLVGGTPGAGDMPGALTFATTADGAFVPTERMRITSTGNVGIGVVSSGAKLAILNDRAVNAYSFAIQNNNGASFENSFIMGFTGTAQYLGNFQSFPLTFVTNNTERMRIEAGGNVGIGTFTPGTSRLAVVGGPMTFDPGASAPLDSDRYFNFDISGSNYARLLVPAGSGGALAFHVGTANAAVERMRITNAGNVGIGASAPGATGFTSFLALGNNNAGIGNAGTNIIGIVTNNAERMRIDASGNVGIGKTPVNGMLDVNGRVSAATGYSLPNDQPIFWGPGDGTTSIYGNSTSDFIYFNTAGAERLRITSAGNVGIGTSSPDKKLSVLNAGSTQFTVDTTAGANDIIKFDTYNASAVAGIYTWSQQGTERMRIDASGNVNIGSTGDGGSKLLVAGNSATTIPVSIVNANTTLNSNSVLYVRSNNSTDAITLISYAQAAGYLAFTQTTGAFIGTTNATNLTLQSNNTNRLRITSGGDVLNISTGGLGYGTGSGGTVTQATSKSTAVTLNKTNGQITMNNASLAAGASVTFGVNCTSLAVTDVVVINCSGGIVSGNNYRFEVINIVASVFYIRVTNISGGALAEAIVLNFAIIKAVTA